MFNISTSNLRCDSLETEQLSRGVGSDDAVSPGHVAQRTGRQEVWQEHGEGKAVVDKERELPVHRLDTDVVSNWRERDFGKVSYLHHVTFDLAILCARFVCVTPTFARQKCIFASNEST